MTAWPTDIPAVVPVFNHATTVGAVVTALRRMGARVVAVDDGSTDGSGEAAGAAGAEVLRLDRNRGKGAALRHGLQAVRGHLAAVTIDADGQHDPQDACRLARAAAADPSGLHLGVRLMTTAPWCSRFGLRLSNAAVRLCCGAAPGDSQSGLRAYPLPAVLDLPVRSGRFAWEVEVIICAVRAGIAIRQLPVSVAYPATRISHFGGVRDSLRLCAAVARLAVRRRP